MRDIAAIKADLAAVEAERRAYNDETERQLRAVRDARAGGYEAIRSRKWELEKELMDAEDAQALANAHPWTGKRVRRIELTYSNNVWNKSPPKETELLGIVETATSATVWPENVGSWKRPKVGQPFVRLLRKDGSPGKAFEKLEAQRPGSTQRADAYWHLVEGE